MRCQSLNFDFVQLIVEKVQNWSILGWSAYTPICSKGLALRDLNTWVGNFFYKMDLLSLWISYKQMLKFSEIEPNMADWKAPSFFQNGQHCGAPNTWVYIFWHKIDPLLICRLYRTLLEIFQIAPFWADWQTPYLSKIMYIYKHIIAQISIAGGLKFATQI